MNQNSRLLPHLNLIYLQKQCYLAHKKKIESIKHSIKTNAEGKHPWLQSQIKIQDQMLSKCLSHKDKDMGIIKQGASWKKENYLSPFDKRRLYVHRLQNDRLQKRLRHSVGTIKHSDLATHSLKTNQLKERLCKFKLDIKSAKVVLKCEFSLSLLRKRERARYRQINSSLSRVMPTDCSLANVRSWSKAESKEDNTQETIRDQLRKSCTPEQREPLSHIFMRRNSRKISEHFERKKENSFMTEIKSRIREIKAKSMAQTRLASCDSSQ